MATLTEINENLTWYKLNSNPNDPVYRYMQKELLRVEKLKQFTYWAVDVNVVVDKAAILQYGNYSCSVPGVKEAYMDSWFTCFLFQLPYFLENIQFAYICYGVLLPIMLISLFGGIKESYRWFLLNQAIWDMLVCYDFICEKPTLLSWTKFNQTQSTCFYQKWAGHWLLRALGMTFRNSVRFLPFTGTLLLTFSRFVAIYFPLFYKRHAKPFRVIAFIALFDVLFLFLINIGEFANQIISNIADGYFNACVPESLGTPAGIAKYFQCNNAVNVWYQQVLNVTQNLIYYISPITFLLANVFAFLLFSKLGWQLKFQLQNNPNNVGTSLRIALVVAFQCCTMTIDFILMSIQTFSFLFSFFNYNDFTIYKNMSPALFLLQHYATTTCFNIIRVFLDSLIVLLVLSGYRDKLFSSFKFFFFCFVKPQKAWFMLKSKVGKNGSGVLFLSSSGKRM